MVSISLSGKRCCSWLSHHHRTTQAYYATAGGQPTLPVAALALMKFAPGVRCIVKLSGEETIVTVGRWLEVCSCYSADTPGVTVFVLPAYKSKRYLRNESLAFAADRILSCSEEVSGWLEDVRVHQYLTTVQSLEKSTNQGADFKFDIDSMDTWFNLDCVPDLTCFVSSCVIW
jgi:hypothetical protein